MTEVSNRSQSPKLECCESTKPSRVRSTVFLSYSHADQDTEWYKDVKEYLEQLSVGGELMLWDDNSINSGDDWFSLIEQHLHIAKAAVLLVTPSFLTSKFISTEEVPKFLNRMENDGLVIHALIGKPCAWEDHELGDFLHSRQLIHSLDTSLEEMDGPKRRVGLNELVKQIRNEIGIYRHRNLHDHRTEHMLEIENLLGISVDKEIAGGDSSIIYSAHKSQHKIAVKAMVSRPITDTGQEELRQEFEKCRDLQSPVFVRMYDLEFNNDYCVTTTDWVPGHRLSRLFVPSRRNMTVQKAWQRKLITILSKLASALSVGHANKLQYINIHPNKIRICGGEPRLYPIDFSTYVASTAHSNGVLAFPVDTLEYLAPEYVTKRAEYEVSSGQQSDADDNILRTEKADQYALAMVALAMLEGRAPVRVNALSDIKQLMEFQSDPRSFVGEGREPLENRQWCRDLPGLARIIWRMLDPNPAHRWDNMQEVHDQLRAIQISNYDTHAHVSEAKESYENYLMGNDEFYKRFYIKLFAAAPEVAGLFADVDMAGQRMMLDSAIERLLNFRPNQREPTTLSRVAHSHRNMGLTGEHFEAFGYAFKEALAEEPGISRANHDAWEAILWPAIEYLKLNAVST